MALAVGIAILAIPFAWVLRDGLGPGMVITEGGRAIAGFALLYAIALLPSPHWLSPLGHCFAVHAGRTIR